MRNYHYMANNGGVIRIIASRRPSERTKPRSGTWVVREATLMPDIQWFIPGCPEITWGILKKLEYLGSTSIEVNP